MEKEKKMFLWRNIFNRRRNIRRERERERASQTKFSNFENYFQKNHKNVQHKILS
jgi:hypothetical protein